MKKALFVACAFLLVFRLSAQTDLSALHAEPTQAEIDAVKADWESRDHTAYNWTVLNTGILLGGFTTEIVSHEVEGNLHYGAVRYPQDYDPNGSYPILVVNHGGASGVNVASINAYSQDCYKNYFIALPSFRSEELRTGNLAPVDYLSEGEPSEMDGDTDDALALLSGVLNIPGADVNRIGVTGGSRGGGVSHIMAAKDSRITHVCAYFGATNHMTLPGLQEKMENYVDNGGPLNPPETATYTYGVAPYLDGILSLAEARLALLRRAPVYFVEDMPSAYQVHHGDVDPVVTVDHSQTLASEFSNQGIVAPEFEYFEYPGLSHSLNGTVADTLRAMFFCKMNDNTSGILMSDCGINIFPNPVEDLLSITITSGNYTIRILDGNGVLHQELNIAASQIIDINSLPSGLFFIEISSEDFSDTMITKILKY